MNLKSILAVGVITTISASAVMANTTTLDVRFDKTKYEQTVETGSAETVTNSDQWAIVATELKFAGDISKGWSYNVNFDMDRETKNDAGFPKFAMLSNKITDKLTLTAGIIKTAAWVGTNSYGPMTQNFKSVAVNKYAYKYGQGAALKYKMGDHSLNVTSVNSSGTGTDSLSDVAIAYAGSFGMFNLDLAQASINQSGSLTDVYQVVSFGMKMNNMDFSVGMNTYTADVATGDSPVFKSTNLKFAYTAGMYTPYLEYTQDVSEDTGADTTNLTGTQMALGVDYATSKEITYHAIYKTNNYEDDASTATETKETSIVLGLNASFGL